jgi:hypothetical protein
MGEMIAGLTNSTPGEAFSNGALGIPTANAEFVSGRFLAINRWNINELTEGNA